ncbi:hypothetical protein N7495_002111 [Penicillium taxi]|uniref:uncharacterized protein n=1 Tax=Penicillium taxi TaxID=168475 RepID=UPI002545B148|nr:uncharacterized protein N7495_002111 [Penicillium taxi]KAJ5901583.1 hypothetical protein N7495_002111 [Penicillium taxi]
MNGIKDESVDSKRKKAYLSWHSTQEIGPGTLNERFAIADIPEQDDRLITADNMFCVAQRYATIAHHVAAGSDELLSVSS